MPRGGARVHLRAVLWINPIEMRTMKRSLLALILCFAALCCATLPLHPQALDSKYARDPNQPIDQHYTDQILKYTTDKSFLSPLVDYLPASKTVPTPEKVLGDVSGAPNMLPYAEDVYKYFRMLAGGEPAGEGVHDRAHAKRAAR